VGVDELLVGSVDKRNSESGRCSDEGQAPVRDKLNKVVGRESGKEGGERGPDVLNEQDSLGLDDEEVDKFMHIADHGIQSFPRDGEVLARAHLGSKTIVKDKLASGLGGDGDAKRHPGKAEGPADEVEVSSGEDGGNDRDKGDSRGTGVLPRQKLEEERVVMSQGLAGGSGCFGCLARSGEVGQLRRGLGSVVLDILRNRAVRDVVVGGGSVCLQRFLSVCGLVSCEKLPARPERSHHMSEKNGRAILVLVVSRMEPPAGAGGASVVSAMATVVDRAVESVVDVVERYSRSVRSCGAGGSEVVFQVERGRRSSR
jgi:hypothetical protein